MTDAFHGVLNRMLIGVTVFLSGGAVMVVELLGVRLISPVYGTGLHVWASLISVALAAIAFGYFVGGLVADRWPSPRLFFVLVGGAGMGVLAIPLYAPALIPAFESMGLRAGALLAAAVTFLPPLFLLGCTAPFAVRIMTLALERVGRTAGRLYAISTLGSVAGTLATGFLLAPLMEIDTTLRILGLAIAGIAGVGLLATRGRAFAVSVAALAAAFVLVPAGTARTPAGEVVFRGDTPFQRVEVLDRDGERWLYLDGCVHTHLIVEGGPLNTWSYIRLFSYLPGFRPEARSLLMLGVGGGALVPLLEAEEYDVTAVEIDPIVLDIARRYFGTLPDEVETHVADARPFVRNADRKWDLVALDVCGSDRLPEHLATVEFFRELKSVLTSGGVVSMNAIAPRDGRTLKAIRRTLAEAFRHVVALATHPDGEVTNVIYFASDEPLELGWPFEEEAAKIRVEFPGGEILTDQWNPTNHWNAPWARWIRERHSERY